MYVYLRQPYVALVKLAAGTKLLDGMDGLEVTRDFRAWRESNCIILDLC